MVSTGMSHMLGSSTSPWTVPILYAISTFTDVLINVFRLSNIFTCSDVFASTKIGPDGKDLADGKSPIWVTRNSDFFITV